MIESGAIVAAIALTVVGFAGILSARERYIRYTALKSTAIEAAETEGETTVSGSIHVDDPAEPEQRPPPDFDAGQKPPGVWVWRIRRKARAGAERKRTRWTTVDGGLAVGDVTIGDGDIGIDISWLSKEFGEGVDPFETPYVHIGKPEQSVPIGRLDPMTRRLERWGIKGEDGVLSGIDLGLSSGTDTMTPDRYQATVLGEGDEILARGVLEEAGERPVLKGTDEHPLVLAIGDVEAKAARLRAAVYKRAGVGTACLLAAGVAFSLAGV